MMKEEKYIIEIAELAITNACSHRCPYCYVGEGFHTTNLHADFNVLCRIIDKLDKYSVKMVALLGGDPAEHPQVIDLAKYIRNNTKIRVSMVSNTLEFAGYKPIEVARYIDSIDFTVHGRNAEEHDSFCGKLGAYDLAMKNLKAFNDLGVIVNIVVNVIPQTHEKIFDIVKNVVDKGIKVSTLLTQRVIKRGRAKGTDIYETNASQVNKAFKCVARIESELGIDISVEDPYPLCGIEEKYHKYMKGCPEGRSRIPVNGFDGRISSCGVVVGEYGGGNILDDTYDAIWTKSPIFEEFRCQSYLLHEKCRDCLLREACGGGCPLNCKAHHAEGEDFIKIFKGEDK